MNRAMEEERERGTRRMVWPESQGQAQGAEGQAGERGLTRGFSARQGSLASLL